MHEANKPMNIASKFVVLSAVLHLAAIPFAGITQETLVFALISVLYLAIAVGLNRGIRIVAWITFFFMLIGMIGALYRSFTPSDIPSLLFVGIAFADFCAACALFVALWRKPALA